jgi:hypothetical protein
LSASSLGEPDSPGESGSLGEPDESGVPELTKPGEPRAAE